MNVEGSIQLNINVNEEEINRAIELLESLVLKIPAPDSAPDNDEEERLRLDKAAEELDKQYTHENGVYRLTNDHAVDHERKSGASRVLHQLPPKVLNTKLKHFQDLFNKAIGVGNDISIYRLSKPLVKSGLVADNIQARELCRIALNRNLIKETRSEVYSKI